MAASATEKRVLVVDNDPFYREIASTSLQAAGYCVAVAADGIEALELLQSTAVDLAIVDLTMPRMDGLKLIEQVRATTINRYLQIIVITGNDDTATIQSAFAAGASSFVAKPVNWPLFAQHVNCVYRSARAEAELRHTVRTAEYMGELKEKLLSVLVSEFQTPLRTAQSMVELMRKEAFGPLGHQTYLDCAQDLHKALQQLATTQLKMMNAGQVLAQDILLIEEEVALRDMLGEALDVLREKAESRAIIVKTSIQLPNSIGLLCDRSLISQAFRLVIEGALQTAPRNSQIAFHAGIDETLGFWLEVVDDGPRLSQEVIRQILDLRSVSRPASGAMTSTPTAHGMKRKPAANGE